VTFAEAPLTGVRVATGPRVRSARLVAAHPRALVPTVTARTRADAVTVRLAGRPAAAVRAAVVEREPAADLPPLRRLLMVVVVLGGQRLRVHRHRPSGR